MSSDHGKAGGPGDPSDSKGDRASDDVAGGARAADESGNPIDPQDDDADELPTIEEELAPEEIGPPPPAVAELVATRYGVMLDFTPDTLSLVDQWVHDARVELAAAPQTVEIVQGAAGAYLGEVIRRAFGGNWFAEGEYDGWRVDLSRVYLTLNPIGMVREALMLESQEGWHSHLETDAAEREDLERRLAALPEVSDEEYFAPTTRFDVVQWRTFLGDAFEPGQLVSVPGTSEIGMGDAGAPR
jgi:hypothetical protein